MATFAEICDQVFEEVNGRPATSEFTSASYKDYDDPFQRRVVRAVLSVWQGILQHTRFWRFLNQRGRILTLVAGTSEYPAPDLYSIEWDSIYLTQDGTTAKWPLFKGSYNAWQIRERATTSVAGIPIELIPAPDPDRWILWPTPTESYYLNGNYQIKAVLPTDVSETPPWDDEFHEVLVWLAVAHLERRVKTESQVVPDRNVVDANTMAQAKYSAFMRHYLPTIT